MGNIWTIDKNSSFHWEYTEEPHKSRRVKILAKYPEIKKFMKSNGDRSLAVIGVFLCIGQILLGFFNNTLLHGPARLLLISCIGTWPATLIMLHAHDAAHGMIFGPSHVWKNRIYGILMNISMGIPFYSFFKKHHKDHHKALGDEILDVEYPSEFEAFIFPNNPVGKFAWLLANPVLYAMRTPLLLVRRSPWGWDAEEVLNLLVVCLTNSLLLACGWSQVVNYLFCSSLIASQSNMFGFWGLMSHTEFLPGCETFSYYGWLNRIYLNFGYHNEHHDFPGVPSRYLPQIRKIAPEFYEDQFELDGFVVAAIKFLFDEKVGVHSRLRRPNATPEKYSCDGSANFRIFPLVEKAEPLRFCEKSNGVVKNGFKKD